MLKVIATRILLTPLVLLGVSLFLFVVSQIIPSDPARLMVGDSVSPEVRAAIETRYGFNEPLHLQYQRYLERLTHGDLGDSLRFDTPVRTLVLNSLPATMQLAGASVLITLVIAFPLGLLAARYRDTWLDVSARAFAMGGYSTPPFYLAIVMILVFGFYLGWFPISGRGNPPDLWHLAMPAFVLGLRDAGSSARVFRAGLLDALGEDYIKSARARGIRESKLVIKLAGRNALIPTITDLGLRIGTLAGQIVLVETVFAWPGIGRLLQIGVLWNDFPLVAGCIFVLLAWLILVNLIVDILYGLIDPRTRTSVPR